MTSGQSQGSLRAVSGLSVLTSSDRRSLKYFVLFKYSALWASRLKELFSIQCTIGKQVTYSYLHIVHYGQTGDTQPFQLQCTMGKQVIHSYFKYNAL